MCSGKKLTSSAGDNKEMELSQVCSLFLMAIIITNCLQLYTSLCCFTYLVSFRSIWCLKQQAKEHYRAWNPLWRRCTSEIIWTCTGFYEQLTSNTSASLMLFSVARAFVFGILREKNLHAHILTNNYYIGFYWNFVLISCCRHVVVSHAFHWKLN